MKTARQIIETLGGPTVVARSYLGDAERRPVVAMWSSRNAIPARHRYAIAEALKKIGYAVEPSFLQPTAHGNEKRVDLTLTEDDLPFAPGLELE